MQKLYYNVIYIQILYCYISIMIIKYYFAIASQDFLLKEEPVEEILRERINYYNNINKPIDFWLVTNPLFINKPEMTISEKQIKKPIVAIISYNPKFIDWLKLRLGFVFTGQLTIPIDKMTNFV